MTEFPFHEAEQLGSRMGMLIGFAVGAIGMMLVRRRSGGNWKRFLNESVFFVVAIAAIEMVLVSASLLTGSKADGSTEMFIQGFMTSFGLTALSVALLSLASGAIGQIVRNRRRL